MLTGQELAGAAHAGLHLIDDEQNVFFLAERRDLGNIVGIQGDNAALALYQLHHDGAGRGIGGLSSAAKSPAGT